MTDEELQTILATRLADIRRRMAKACRRAERDPAEVTLVAVTKTVSARVAMQMLTLGCHDLAENRPQELWKKQQTIPTARWHFIGHMQRNKLEKTIPLCTLIHSVDSDRLLQAIHDWGCKRGSPVDVLLEVNCSREESKGGFRPEELPGLFPQWQGYTGIVVRGLMTMAAYHDDPELCRATFTELRIVRDQLQSKSGQNMPLLSMGMSNDFEVAIEEGATHVRIGTTLFEGLDSVDR